MDPNRVLVANTDTKSVGADHGSASLATRLARCIESMNRSQAVKLPLSVWLVCRRQSVRYRGDTAPFLPANKGFSLGHRLSGRRRSVQTNHVFISDLMLPSSASQTNRGAYDSPYSLPLCKIQLAYLKDFSPWAKSRQVRATKITFDDSP